MSNYVVDPNDSTKMIPAQKQSQNASGIATFTTDAAAQVSNPVAGTMTYSTESDKIFIYNGTAWKTFTRD